MKSDRADKDEILFEERDKYSNLGMDEIIEISSMSSAYMFNFVIWDNGLKRVVDAVCFDTHNRDLPCYRN